MATADRATVEALEDIRLELRALRREVSALRAAVPHRLVSAKEAASMLGLHPETVIKRLDSGELAGRRVGRRVLIDLTSAKNSEGGK